MFSSDHSMFPRVSRGMSISRKSANANTTTAQNGMRITKVIARYDGAESRYPWTLARWARLSRDPRATFAVRASTIY